eukprot:CAMPEP_0194082742 /NCGR_PEP_ID=MMETSP0149-20130528/8172_1 /TAXON_ID=122233 /ORGANISM="Chaetoceros debilis, Strain MM31A-1" /LENGTH=924 /DNA_ID=CAMNT_0038764969 /DNA_START=156 /DNA_END=2930 /DNA_ORIENTATION=-
MSMINHVILCDAGTTLQENGNASNVDSASGSEKQSSPRQLGDSAEEITTMPKISPDHFKELTIGYKRSYKTWNMVGGKCAIKTKKYYVPMNKAYECFYYKTERDAQLEAKTLSSGCFTDQLIQCGSNSENSKTPSISKDAQGITLRQLRAVIANIDRRCIPEEWIDLEGNQLRPETVTLRDVNKYMIKPFTANSKKSFVELLPSTLGIQPPNFYTNHWWGETVKDFVASLEQYLMDLKVSDSPAVDENGNSFGKHMYEDIPVWIHAYSVNQWELKMDQGQLEMDHIEEIHQLKMENEKLRQDLRLVAEERDTGSARNSSLVGEIELLKKNSSTKGTEAKANASIEAFKKGQRTEQCLEQMSAMVNEVKELVNVNGKLHGAWAESKEIHKQLIQESAKTDSLTEQIKQNELLSTKEKTQILEKNEEDLKSLRKKLNAVHKVEKDELQRKARQENVSRKKAEIEKKKAVVAYEEALKRTLEAEAHLARMSAMIEEAKVFVASKEKLYQTLNVEIDKRKELHNMLEDIKGRIRVYVRLRPMIESEKENNFEESLSREDNRTCVMYREDERGSFSKSWEFDNVFDGTSEANSQESVFDDTKKLITSAVDGFNVCIFAYGQTGGGKTYTMFGPPGETEQFERLQKLDRKAGLAPRAAVELFRVLDEKRENFDITVTVNMFEVYNDAVKDLLASPSQRGEAKAPLRIKLAEHSESGLVEVEGSVSEVVEDAYGLLNIFKRGSEYRSTAATRMNADSSRSHLITSIVTKLVNKRTGNVTSGKLTICDLAGSERVRKSGSTGSQLKEAQSINKSLSSLGTVINSLTTDSKHVPYRNHALTMLMSDSMGGNAKTLMFVCCSPADYNVAESSNSLDFARRCKNVTNNVHGSSASTGDLVQIKALKAEVSRLKSLRGDALRKKRLITRRDYRDDR